MTANGYFLDEGAKNKSGKKSNYKFSAKIFCEKTKRKSAQRVVWLKETMSYFPDFFQKERAEKRTNRLEASLEYV
ncbi:hypothetical protein A3781_05060 [Bacillus badius]|nr:hypothetical protein A3781_05060 [Bacillus badius]